jgi:hypothetical protein
MSNETRADNDSEIEKCQVKARGASGLVDCLMEKAGFCQYALPFGYGYFCQHPRQKELAEYAEKLRNKSSLLSDVSQSENQE